MRRPVAETLVVGGPNVQRLFPAPLAAPRRRSEMDDRQARIFGDAGQALFSRLKVGVIGAGGVGMPMVSHLARLGVGHLVVIDPDRVEPSNLPRLPETTRWDARLRLSVARLWVLRQLGARLASPKVRVARRIARRARRGLEVTALHADVVESGSAQQLTDCDYLFLAANTHQARAVFNALVHQYLIPGVQVGSLVEVDGQSGEVGEIFSVVRPVSPDSGCLLCNGLISPAKLQEEALSEGDRAAQRYGLHEDAPAPSVMSLNSLGVSRAANDFMLSMSGLRRASESHGAYVRLETRGDVLRYEHPRRSADCLDCGHHQASIRGRGDGGQLPVKPKR